MNLPRLIIADESRPGKIPAGVLIAAILKDMGYKLKLFMGNIDETSMRVLQLLCNQPVTLLNPTLCDGRSNLRWLFQQAASPDCLNLILTNLGGRWSEDTAFRVPRDCFKLADWLDCEMIPIVYSDTSSVIAVRTLTEILKQFERVDDVRMRIHAIIFRSVLNNREFELLDREVGRQLTAMSIGSIPQMIERDHPLITDLCSENANSAILPMKSAAVQLKSMDKQIDWAVLSALSQVSMDWTPQPRLTEPITDQGLVNIAVIRHPALTLGGDGTEHLFRTLGCNVVDIPLDGQPTQNVPIHGVYIPHGLGYMTLKHFFSNLYVKTLLGRGVSGQSFLLAEGGAAPILGDKVFLPSAYGGGGEGRGFGALPYDSRYTSASFRSPLKMVATSRKKRNPLLSGSQEWAWGYTSSSLQIVQKDGDEACWNISENLQTKPSGLDGWTKGRMLASCMRIEPWSTPETFRRWLEG